MEARVNFYSDCMTCKYYEESGMIRACVAFPDEIPSSIWFTRKGHRNKVLGQIGEYIFEPNDNSIKNGLVVKTKRGKYKRCYEAEEKQKKEEREKRPIRRIIFLVRKRILYYQLKKIIKNRAKASAKRSDQ